MSEFFNDSRPCKKQPPRLARGFSMIKALYLFSANIAVGKNEKRAARSGAVKREKEGKNDDGNQVR